MAESFHCSLETTTLLISYNPIQNGFGVKKKKKKKNPTANTGNVGLIPGLERSPGKGNILLVGYGPCGFKSPTQLND